MYPYIRLAQAIWRARRSPPLGIVDTHVSQHRIWPWDLDPWMELNNGRTLTLFDLGRIPMSLRLGFHRAAQENGWGLTVAGNSTRYRKRVTVFTVLTHRARVLGWDDRFAYVEQSFWNGDDCTAHMLLRSAFIAARGSGKSGIIPPATVVRALGQNPVSPALPDWARAWIDADAMRNWPPDRT
jgi:acyl-CoA thioesterase FadM